MNNGKGSILKYTVGVSVFCALFTVAAVSPLWSNLTTREVPFVPVTISYVDKTFNGDEVSEKRTLKAIRSDRALVEASYRIAEDGSVRELRSVMDLDARTRTSIATQTKSTTTYYYSEDEVDGLRNSSIRCPRSRREDAQILGYEVIKQTRERVGDGNSQRYTVAFLAPDLGCALLQAYTYERILDGNDDLINQLEVEAIIVGEPDPELYAVPADFVELSPAEYIENAARIDGAMSSVDLDLLLTLQEAYNYNHFLNKDVDE